MTLNKTGADGGSRTHDDEFCRLALWPLSYIGIGANLTPNWLACLTFGDASPYRILTGARCSQITGDREGPRNSLYTWYTSYWVYSLGELSEQ